MFLVNWWSCYGAESYTSYLFLRSSSDQRKGRCPNLALCKCSPFDQTERRRMRLHRCCACPSAAPGSGPGQTRDLSTAHEVRRRCHRWSAGESPLELTGRHDRFERHFQPKSATRTHGSFLVCSRPGTVKIQKRLPCRWSGVVCRSFLLHGQKDIGTQASDRIESRYADRLACG